VAAAALAWSWSDSSGKQRSGSDESGEHAEQTYSRGAEVPAPSQPQGEEKEDEEDPGGREERRARRAKGSLVGDTPPRGVIGNASSSSFPSRSGGSPGGVVTSPWSSGAFGAGSWPCSVGAPASQTGMSPGEKKNLDLIFRHQDQHVGRAPGAVDLIRAKQLRQRRRKLKDANAEGAKESGCADTETDTWTMETMALLELELTSSEAPASPTGRSKRKPRRRTRRGGARLVDDAASVCTAMPGEGDEIADESDNEDATGASESLLATSDMSNAVGVVSEDLATIQEPMHCDGVLRDFSWVEASKIELRHQNEASSAEEAREGTTAAPEKVLGTAVDVDQVGSSCTPPEVQDSSTAEEDPEDVTQQHTDALSKSTASGEMENPEDVAVPSKSTASGETQASLTPSDDSIGTPSAAAERESNAPDETNCGLWGAKDGDGVSGDIARAVGIRSTCRPRRGSSWADILDTSDEDEALTTSQMPIVAVQNATEPTRRLPCHEAAVPPEDTCSSQEGEGPPQLSIQATAPPEATCNSQKGGGPPQLAPEDTPEQVTPEPEHQPCAPKLANEDPKPELVLGSGQTSFQSGWVTVQTKRSAHARRALRRKEDGQA